MSATPGTNPRAFFLGQATSAGKHSIVLPDSSTIKRRWELRAAIELIAAITVDS